MSVKYGSQDDPHSTWTSFYRIEEGKLASFLGRTLERPVPQVRALLLGSPPKAAQRNLGAIVAAGRRRFAAKDRQECRSLRLRLVTLATACGYGLRLGAAIRDQAKGFSSALGP